MINRIGIYSASMSYEIECPVCDRKAPASARVCQHCGADLNMASFDDLEEIAQNIATGKLSAKSEPKPTSAPPEIKQGPAPAKVTSKEEPESPKPTPKPQITPLEAKAEEAAAVEKAKGEKKEDEGKHGLGRLFGKKKK